MVLFRTVKYNLYINVVYPPPQKKKTTNKQTKTMGVQYVLGLEDYPQNTFVKTGPCT